MIIKTKNGVIVKLSKIRWFKTFIDRLKLARTYNDEDLIMEKPVYLKEIRDNLKEDIGQVEAEVDSSNTFYETMEGISN